MELKIFSSLRNWLAIVFKAFASSGCEEVHSEPSASTSACTSIIDPSSPLFLSSSDVPGISLTIPFSEVGFGRMELQWDRCNNMVISWLTHSLSPDIVESVQYSETTESIWKQLNNRYGAVNGTKLKKVWDELGVMCTTHANSCVYAAKEGLQREKEEDKVHQFFMGLNEVYVGVRSNLLMMQPLPSLDSVYNILLQDEK
ncbi:uncharacterized protein [Nicotiana sylvestris]|uniref:Retrotransposon Copia-like N-terminal domain-containing protein n=2 Tax=Nicotiana TaxID=4085 RepID=A0A1S4D4H5_TOBAC|nr:PREDICTED: uncharacterized protein LOC104219227 [Nicotiana sylvestris]XP_016508330.1 PREDICTED: uncharacterized protein LOC107825919 [Nicotiana tabacum]